MCCWLHCSRYLALFAYFRILLCRQAAGWEPGKRRQHVIQAVPQLSSPFIALPRPGESHFSVWLCFLRNRQAKCIFYSRIVSVGQELHGAGRRVRGGTKLTAVQHKTVSWPEPTRSAKIVEIPPSTSIARAVRADWQRKCNNNLFSFSQFSVFRLSFSNRRLLERYSE